MQSFQFENLITILIALSHLFSHFYCTKKTVACLAMCDKETKLQRTSNKLISNLICFTFKVRNINAMSRSQLKLCMISNYVCSTFAFKNEQPQKVLPWENLIFFIFVCFSLYCSCMKNSLQKSLWKLTK